MWNALIFLLLVISCADKYVEVNVEGFKFPRENFTDLESVGLIIDSSFDVDFSKKIVDSLQTCKNFGKLNPIKGSIDLDKIEPKDYKQSFESMIKKNKEARQQNGILTINLSVSKVSKKLERSTAFKFYDRKDQGWYENYGVPTRPQLGYSSQWEIGPKRKSKKKSIYIRVTDFHYKVKYALYNRVKGQIAAEGTLETTSALSVFSSKPAVDREMVEEALLTGIKNRIALHVCNDQPPLTQQIYYFPNNTKEGKLVNEGVELAEENRWPLAATKWKNAILTNKKNSIAHHNLGIYYEFIGRPLKALDHFRQAQKGPLTQIIEKPRLDEFMLQYLMPKLGKGLLAQIAFFTAADWAFIYANGNDLKINKTYPIFRIKIVRDPQDLSVKGSHLMEIGSIRISFQKDSYYVGRIRTAGVDYQIQPGDFILN